MQAPQAPEIEGFEVLRLLGQGGFGSVFAARRKSDQLDVAIKLARADLPEAGVRLDHEREALQAIGPPHVPKVYGGGVASDGSRFIAMEYIAAPTLAEQMAQRQSPYSLGEFAAHAALLLDAVLAVHLRGLVHRDLKPENIFMAGPPPHARLVDFGLVRANAAPAGGGVTEGRAIGTAEYMPPEQCVGGEVDLRADIYSLGVIFYEMLAGRPPFFGTSADVQQGHIGRRPPRPSSFAPLSAELEEVILRCLAKERDLRFADVPALRGAVLEALAPSAGRTQTQTPRAPSTLTAGATSGREKRSAGLVFFEAEADTQAVLEMMRFFAGTLAHASGTSCVGLFGHEASENPARRALQAAQGIVARGLAKRALVDLAAVTVQTRADGSKRYLSPALMAKDRFPTESDPPGILLTHKAAEVLGELHLNPVASRGGVFHVVAIPLQRAEATTLKDVPQLVGREEPLETLLGAAQAAVERGQPGLATVIAEAGVGKSHLCGALILRLHEALPHCKLMQLRAREPVSGDLDGTLRDLLTRVLGLPPACPPDGGRALIERSLGPAASRDEAAAVALVLGWIAVDAPEVRALAAAPGMLRGAVTRALSEGLRRRAAERPLLVVVDDAQWAGQSTLDALELAAAPDAQVPLWVGVMARPMLERMRTDWGEKAAEPCTIRLGPLPAESAAELCRALLLPAENVPAGAIELLVARTQGVPLLMVELVRMLKGQGIVRRRATGESWYVATDELDRLPNSPMIEWLAQRELDVLPPELAAHARLLALLGPAFTLNEVGGLLAELDREEGADVFPLDAAIGTQRLQATGLVVAHRDNRMTFRHALVRDWVAGTVPQALASAIHRAAFRFYKTAAWLPDETRLPRLAFQAAQCGERAEAASAYLSLADRARMQHAYIDAELLFTRLLEQLDAEGAMRTRAHQGRGIMRYRIARYEDALADLAAARRGAEALGNQALLVEILLDEAMALDWLENYQESRARLETAEAVAKRFAPPPPIAAALLLGRGRSEYRFNQLNEAVEFLSEAARVAEPIMAESYETLVVSLLMLGGILPIIGRLDDAEAAFDRVIPLCRERGDMLHLAASINNRQFLWMYRNDKERMLADSRELLEITRRTGELNLEKQTHLNVAHYLYWIGEADHAEESVVRAIEIDTRRHGALAPAESLLLHARILRARGQDGRARALLDEIRSRQALLLTRGESKQLLVPSDGLLLRMLELALENGSDESWDELLRRAKQEAGEQDIIASAAGSDVRLELLDVMGQIAQKQGRTDRARRAWQQALELSRRLPNALAPRIRDALARLEAQS